MEDGKMKRLIIITTFLITLILAGVLYGRISRPDEGETIKRDHYAYMNQFPDPMPNIDFMLGPGLVIIY